MAEKQQSNYQFRHGHANNVGTVDVKEQINVANGGNVHNHNYVQGANVRRSTNQTNFKNITVGGRAQASIGGQGNAVMYRGPMNAQAKEAIKQGLNAPKRNNQNGGGNGIYDSNTVTNYENVTVGDDASFALGQKGNTLMVNANEEPAPSAKSATAAPVGYSLDSDQDQKSLLVDILTKCRFTEDQITTVMEAGEIFTYNELEELVTYKSDSLEETLDSLGIRNAKIKVIKIGASIKKFQLTGRI